jgi:hypothetical protein
MLLIAVEVEYALNEVLEKHGRVPLQQQVSQAELPKAAKERGRRRLTTHRVTKNSAATQESTELKIHPNKQLKASQGCYLLRLFRLNISFQSEGLYKSLLYQALFIAKS